MCVPYGAESVKERNFREILSMFVRIFSSFTGLKKFFEFDWSPVTNRILGMLLIIYSICLELLGDKHQETIFFFFCEFEFWYIVSLPYDDCVFGLSVEYLYNV